MKSIEHRDSIIELVEKMFAIEQNRNKKFELLKLKSLIQSMPIESHRVVEPTIVEETKNDKLDINKLKFL
jgi:hypothetical protein